MKLHALLILCIFTLTVCVGGKVVFAENIDPLDDGSQFAYGENIGWLNFEPGSGDGVIVGDTALTSYAWAENIGWINLSPSGHGGVVNDGHGNLSGYAWGENVGWINFDPEPGGVTIDYDGNFDGWAWGENIGWIHFRNPDMPYKVQTEWLKPIPTWYEDLDEDGYGNAEVSIVQPDQPPGYVSNPDDCDDTDPFTYPGAEELCDGKDNDCDSVIPATEIDDDGDDMAECQGDCDDTDPTVFQGATELCDGIDNDCDGSPGTEEVDADGDGYMVCAGDCDDTNPDIYPGNAKDTYIIYNGDFVVQADDYSTDPPTGGVNLSALLTDSDSQVIEGWEVDFDIYNTEDIWVASVSAFTDSFGIAHVVQDLPVGVYNVNITFTGDDCFYFSSNNSAVIAVYDPTGGFATGGGWYEADDGVTGESGRANFGLNVKYKQEASAGNLEFQFQAGDINLKSTSIDWLVISEANAQFKGQGRINGVDGYFFRVIAKDLGEPGAGSDEFNIKIWDGDPDDTDSSLLHSSKNLLEGGNIVVHTNNRMHSCSEGLGLLSFLLSSNPSGNTSLFGMAPYNSLVPLSTPQTLYNNVPYNNVTSYNTPLFAAYSLSRASIPAWNISLFGMVPYGYASDYNSPGMPLYNNMASYYMPLLGMSSFGLPFYGMSPSTFYGISPLNIINMPLFNTLNPGLGGINYGLGGSL